MKAYIVSENRNYEKQILVFAETANKAKAEALRNEEMDGIEYVELSVRRAKYADGHENKAEHELMLLNIQNGWWYEIGGVRIDIDNLSEMQSKGII